MDYQERLRAINRQRWEGIYEKWARGEATGDLLSDSPEADADFERALGLLEIASGRVLDVGCGWGHLSLQIARRGFEVVGVDISPTAIWAASQRALQLGMPCVFAQRDIFAAPPQEVFDVVTDRGCLSVLERQKAAEYLERIHSLLKARGYFLLKVDSTKLRGLSDFPVQFGRLFAAVAEWSGSYTRLDGNEVKASFFVGRRGD